MLGRETGGRWRSIVDEGTGAVLTRFVTENVRARGRPWPRFGAGEEIGVARESDGVDEAMPLLIWVGGFMAGLRGTSREVMLFLVAMNAGVLVVHQLVLE